MLIFNQFGPSNKYEHHNSTEGHIVEDARSLHVTEVTFLYENVHIYKFCEPHGSNSFCSIFKFQPRTKKKNSAHLYFNFVGSVVLWMLFEVLSD